jgi:hypothetical protein
MKHPSPFKIEQDVPIPRENWTGNNRYPFRDMKVGDSFFISSDTPGEAALRVRSSVCYFSKRNPEYHFTVLKVDGGCRVWRIAKKRYARGGRP